MDSFTYYSPTYFEFGRGAEKKVAELVKQFGGTNILVHYGQKSVIESGLLATVLELLDNAGIQHTELGGVVANPRSGLVYKGINICRREKIDFILAVGGGSVIDSAKAIAAGTLYEGDFWDFYCGTPIKLSLPIGTILTISAAGSESSPNSVITNEATNTKAGTKSDVSRARFSILNPEFTYTLPPFQTAAGATDIMIHICERYFSNTDEVELTDNLCEAVLKTMIVETPRVIANPSDYEARANIMFASTLAHNNICGVGREQDWASHTMAHVITSDFDATHGAALAVLFPTWMEFVAKKHTDQTRISERFSRFATNVWTTNKDCAVTSFRSFLDSIGMPKTLSTFGISEENLPHLASKVGYNANGTIGSFVKLTKEDVLEIFRMAL